MTGQLGELGCEAQVRRARVWERNSEVADDLAGTGPHHQHARAEEHGLVDAVRDEQRGEPDALPSPDFKLIASGNRPGDNAESFELYARLPDGEKNVTEKAKTP